jgi:hypothetical protein
MPVFNGFKLGTKPSNSFEKILILMLIVGLISIFSHYNLTEKFSAYINLSEYLIATMQLINFPPADGMIS